ncbi:murein biosynthesis integral membrane protein MurJ [uncultured Parasphingopyxis sp.]|uniref:murein biosynthesis integral membrane protein MurJ n=1 Tax=uncultured Parasphingopyxis sp. TaxID=1547918 RepID=UPI00262D3AE8|nr:murein biosynthesis integral membrane protein MurJ [uncultured Parasphingopyxis sp.]
MNLYRATGTIGGLTLVSRIAGFAREMIFARVLGANAVTDAFFQAFILPNVFRRLFAEGAFSAAFVPMFSRRLNGEGGLESARSFSTDVLSVFLPILIVVAVLFELAMPGVIWLLSDKDVAPDQFDLATDLARITFPYIVLISLTTLFTGMLNSVSRFAPGASFPIILNIMLIGALLFGERWIDAGATIEEVAYLLSWTVAAAGLVQLGWVIYWVRVEGFSLKIRKPVLTPEVKRLGIIALPAAIGGGAYQINTLLQLYFLNQLEGSMISYMNYADRLNQLPLGIIGIALGTAILPALSKHIGGGEKESADRVQSNAIELAMLLTIPAAVALAICGSAFVTMIFQGGRFEAEDAAIVGNVVVALVCGLPAYVLVKVLVPGFYARSDTKTPLYAALGSLAFFIIFNIAFLQRFGVVGVAAASAIGAWLNVAILYAILVARDYYSMPAVLVGRLARQLLAAAAMGAALWFLADLLTEYYDAGIFARLFALLGLSVAGAIVYFGVGYAVGAIDRDKLALLFKRKAQS